jgi:hypothetical protein
MGCFSKNYFEEIKLRTNVVGLKAFDEKSKDVAGS